MANFGCDKPGWSRDQIIFVKPRREHNSLQLGFELPNCRLVFAVVGEQHVNAHLLSPKFSKEPNLIRLRK